MSYVTTTTTAMSDMGCCYTLLCILIRKYNSNIVATDIVLK